MLPVKYLGEIRRRGFSLIVMPDRGPLTVDWDQVQEIERMRYFPPRPMRRRSLAAQRWLAFAHPHAARLSMGSGGPYITVAGGSSGYSIQAASPDVCVHFHDPAPCDDKSFRLPLDALKVCEGRDDAPVVIEGHPGNRVLLSWTVRGVPRRHEVDQPKAGSFSFPDLPTSFTANDAEMWAALREAVATTDAESTRYDLGCCTTSWSAASLAEASAIAIRRADQHEGAGDRAP